MTRSGPGLLRGARAGWGLRGFRYRPAAPIGAAGLRGPLQAGGDQRRYFHATCQRTAIAAAPGRREYAEELRAFSRPCRPAAW